ncbi:MAG: sigma-54-dependent Fis family transcriptional regulator [Proteobacteria bacterium]|nr:sigma-54-dependent Fis family transcriptional regulator [Pseudomonadota bacterium]
MQDKFHILLVDDEEQMLSAMEAVIARMGHAVIKTRNGKEALEVIEKGKIDLVISDMRMPVMTGNELLEKIHQHYPSLPTVMITAYGTITQAVDVMKNGAFDFITKPFSADDLERVVQRVIRPEKKQQSSANEGTKVKQNTLAIVTADEKFKSLLELAIHISPSSASVLIQGESGTGKELMARLVHSSSGRTGSFVAVNCAALPEHLLESELFGHEKGSFTGAISTKIGKFELANNGTILLDEITEMDLSLQAKLLRVLQEREVDRVGSQKPIPVDVRIIATTNRELKSYVAEGKFREDLYYRLNVIPLNMPPLRERRGDIKTLAEHFVRVFANGRNIKLATETISLLERHSWPGNIRELQNCCERAALLCQEELIQVKHFMLGELAAEKKSGDEELKLYSGLTVSEAEKKLIMETLRATDNNKTKAAELLGISIRTLRNKLHEYGVSSEEIVDTVNS